jgi:ubiquinone/menaquinone biosynthesis C-methylase UbiE
MDNMSRVLKEGGRYILISLLQEHILEKVLEYFSQWSIEIYETVIEKSKLYPFFIVLKKIPQQEKSNTIRV